MSGKGNLFNPTQIEIQDLNGSFFGIIRGYVHGSLFQSGVRCFFQDG